MIKAKKVQIIMSTDNSAKIIDGTKWTTLRTEKQYNKIGLDEGETGLVTYGNHRFLVYCHGLQHISNLDWNIRESEFFGENGPMFQHTRDFLEGKISLYIYSFEEIHDV